MYFLISVEVRGETSNRNDAGRVGVAATGKSKLVGLDITQLNQILMDLGGWNHELAEQFALVSVPRSSYFFGVSRSLNYSSGGTDTNHGFGMAVRVND